ncbi:hypothetical protein CISG_05953 [Coccidioides immitis RMSCC 3703]|uniref:Uncharacterized protein n=1 Tax=Coccidioides immitis RMSCC 3703 TaxID=454286 RepID=A0A0J8TSZ1_COCIT|nr:hypothetical protein CISG_05953 [Coccidioides immitis RMSCC 3703]
MGLQKGQLRAIDGACATQKDKQHGKLKQEQHQTGCFAGETD